MAGPQPNPYGGYHHGQGPYYPPPQQPPIRNPQLIHAPHEYAAFVGNNFETYWQKWNNGKSWSWNISALFAGLFWLGYRKMYIYILIIFACYLFIDAATILLFDKDLDNGIFDMVQTVTALVLTVFFGVGGNSLYLNYVNKKISQLKAQYPDPYALQGILVQRGGTSAPGILFPILMLFVYLVFLGIIVS